MAVWKLNRMVNDMQTPRFCRMEKIAPQQFEGAEALNIQTVKSSKQQERVPQPHKPREPREEPRAV
jgi:hypothetical protein